MAITDTLLASLKTSIKNVLSHYVKSGTIASAESLGLIRVGENLEIDPTTGVLKGTAKVDVDDALSTTSVNPVQNKVITNTLENSYAKKTLIASADTLGLIRVGENLEIDSATGVLKGTAKVDVDDELSETSENPVQNKVIYYYIERITGSNINTLNALTRLSDNDINQQLQIKSLTDRVTELEKRIDELEQQLSN